MRKRKKRGKRDSSRLLKMPLFFVLSGCVLTVLLSLALPRGAPSLTNAQDSDSKSNLYNRSPEVSFNVDDTTGMICMPDVGFELAEKGDVVHVGAYYKWRHALLVTDVIKDESGNVLDLTVASNTADRWYYPLSAYIYTAPRLIHIVGQN